MTQETVSMKMPGPGGGKGPRRPMPDETELERRFNEVLIQARRRIQNRTYQKLSISLLSDGPSSRAGQTPQKL